MTQTVKEILEKYKVEIGNLSISWDNKKADSKAPLLSAIKY